MSAHSTYLHCLQNYQVVANVYLYLESAFVWFAHDWIVKNNPLDSVPRPAQHQAHSSIAQRLPSLIHRAQMLPLMRLQLLHPLLGYPMHK